MAILTTTTTMAPGFMRHNNGTRRSSNSSNNKNDDTTNSGSKGSKWAIWTLLTLLCISFVLAILKSEGRFQKPLGDIVRGESLRNHLNLDKKHRRVLIHIGKAAGRSVRLQAYPWIDFEVHTQHGYNSVPGIRQILMEEFKVHSTDHLYITVRDPLKRAVSAWKFAEEGIQDNVESLSTRLCPVCSPEECVQLFDSINDLAGSLNDDPLANAVLEGGCIRHLRENYTFFIDPLHDFIQRHPSQVDLIRVEHLQEDLQRIFGVDTVSHTHGTGKNGGGRTPLTPSAHKKLRKALEPEYRIYNWLLKLKGLDP